MILSVSNSIAIVELLGVLAFAFTGIIEARKKGMDLIGVYTVSMIAAFGGGTIRDLLIGNYPLFWIEHSGYAIMLFGFALASASLGATFYDNPKVSSAFEVFDTLGLGLFCTAGASVAHQAGCDFYISMLLGVVTAIFGGIFRDIICNEIPKVFQRNELYATCAAFGSIVFLIGLQIGLSSLPAMLAGVFATALLRLLSVKYKIKLPL
jgi:uncharacterized membrane protein YeiH